LNGALEALTKKQLSDTKRWNALCICGANGRLEKRTAAFSKETLKADDQVRGRRPRVMHINALDIRRQFRADQRIAKAPPSGVSANKSYLTA
jgi:hypothetical protein